MELLAIVEFITVGITLLMFTSGLPVCYEMIKNRNTKNVPYHFFLLGFIGCEGMLHYGIMLGINSLIYLNLIGSILQALYAFLYLLVCSSKFRPILYLFAAIAYISAIYGYINIYNLAGMDKANVLGLSSSSVTTVTMVLPIFEIIDNFKNKNADGMPKIMLLFGSACSISWLIYGLMLNDSNIYAPNIPGLSINFLKLYAISLYGENAEKKKTV